MVDYRIYYKRSRGFPFIWSIDSGYINSQQVVTQFHIGKRCEVSGGSDFVSNIENSPQVFIIVRANSMDIVNDEAYFK